MPESFSHGDLQRTHPRQLRPTCVTHKHELDLSPSPTRLTTATSVHQSAYAAATRSTTTASARCPSGPACSSFSNSHHPSAERLPVTTGSTREIPRLDRGLNWAPMR